MPDRCWCRLYSFHVYTRLRETRVLVDLGPSASLDQLFSRDALFGATGVAAPTSEMTYGLNFLAPACSAGELELHQLS
jgi:hypothetical protein